MQGNWVIQEPVKFGGVKLVNAADPKYLGIFGHDELFYYDGVGSTITCKLNVRETFQTPSTCRFTLASLFSSLRNRPIS